MDKSNRPIESSREFLSRFDDFARDYRRNHKLRRVYWTLTVVLGVLAGIAAVDFLIELQYPVRASLSALLLTAAAVGTIVGVHRLARTATNLAIAAQIEDSFPELGQAVRTAVQYRDEPASAGASPSLLAAMQSDLSARTAVLPLDRALNRSRARRAAVSLGAAAAIILAVLAISWQWRIAAQRAMFSDKPFTTLNVEPGDAQVEEGSSLRIAATMEGRLRPAVLMTRPADAGDADWLARDLLPEQEVRRDDSSVQYEISLANVEEPLEYRLVAGPYSSPPHQVSVQRLLTVESTRVEVTPPEYAGAKPAVFNEGNFRGLEGSRVRFEATLDQPVREATLELTPLGGRADDNAAATQTTPLRVDGRKLTGEFELSQDAVYSVAGRGVSGARLRDNRFRIRVLKDQLPRVAFRQPDFEDEVHSLAEVKLVAHVIDDFGLTKAGILFRVNNGREYPLATLPAASSKAAGGHAANRIAILEAVLPLEDLAVTPRDSISYYAYAEDNAPSGRRRIETEVRFLDIRPFRRIVHVPQQDGGGIGGGGGRPLASLDQLIRRERWLLNQSLRLDRAGERRERINVDEVDDAMRLQDDTAELTRELGDAAAEAEAQLGVTEDRISDLFYAAEQSMMRAIDALSVSKFETSHLQQVDAAASLVAARNAIEFIIGQGGGGGVAFKKLFRLNEELLRRMRNRGNPSRRMEDASRQLRSLARREERVAKDLQELEQLSAVSNAGADSTSAPIDERSDRAHEIDDEQSRISQEVEDVDKIVQGLETVTEKIRSRSSASVEAARAVSAELDRMSWNDAAAAARRASRKFHELARNIEGVAPNEPAGRLAAARDVAASVALELRDVGAGLTIAHGAALDSSASLKPAASRAPKAEADVAQPSPEELLQSAETINDILDSIVTTFAARQDDVVPRLRQVLEASEVGSDATLIEQIETSLLADRWTDASLAAETAGERYDQLSQRLDALYASLVEPRIAQLQAFERRALDLQSQMTQLTSTAQVNRWRQTVAGFVTDLESAKITIAAVDELRQILQQKVSTSSQGAEDEAWTSGTDGLLRPPTSNVTAVDDTVREIQRYLYELAFGRIDAERPDAAPPQYLDLVRRYLQRISEGDGG
jgi:hypothetical protein